MLRRLDDHLELPMALLGIVWLALFIMDVVRGLTPLLTALSTIIWVVFIAEFLLRLALAPRKWAYLRRTWLTAVALVVPALRVGRLAVLLRPARFARAARGVRLVRAVGSLNRGLGALGGTLRRTGAWYVTLLAVLVCLGGAAGMYALEPRGAGETGFASYGDALWWTTMIMTTMGSAYWPQTAEGRILAVLLSLVAIGVFGYVTATLASFLVGRDAAAGEGELAGGAELRALRREVAALRVELRAAREGGGGPGPAPSGLDGPDA
ncbi:MAG TPA: ion transporter [Gemmatimonadaceae bacterium]